MSSSNDIQVKNDNTPPLKTSFFGRVIQNLNSNLIPALSVATAISSALMGISAWNTWSTYQKFNTSLQTNIKLNQLSDQVIYYDEVLTMSARMAASTGDLFWESRYNDYAPKLDETIRTIITTAPQYEQDVKATDAANIALVEMETKSFNLVRENRAPEALKLLQSPVYEEQKQIYKKGVDATINNIKNALSTDLANSNRQLINSTILALLSFPIVIICWLGVLSLVRQYIRQRNQAETSLEKLNLELENRVKLRTQQLALKEETTRLESELLQADVENILDVVSAVESGDLTVSAPVSEGVTGLVSDTLNRLTEELVNVMSNVLNAAFQVSQGSQNLEQAAQEVASNSQQQAQSVTRVLQFTEQVQHAAESSKREIQASTESLAFTRATVNHGQEAIASLNEDIDTLREGTDRIIQQMKTLGEFVGQTDQFVQEQSQIASLTQVLAMNASLVAARASEQRDPAQFVVVAREFEAIANQVAALAQRTNEGLVRLEQRSNQIHSVVSAVDAKVQNLGELVKEFTQGVEQSSQIFNNIQTVTQQAVVAGEVVQQSNQKIVSFSLSMVQLMGEISDLATQTVQLSQAARTQSQQLETLSENLLKNIQFFQLPAPEVKEPDLTTI